MSPESQDQGYIHALREGAQSEDSHEPMVRQDGRLNVERTRLSRVLNEPSKSVSSKVQHGNTDDVYIGEQMRFLRSVLESGPGLRGPGSESEEGGGEGRRDGTIAPAMQRVIACRIR